MAVNPPPELAGLIEKMRSGHYRAMLIENSREWRALGAEGVHALSHVVRYAVEEERGADLYSVLTDPEFHALRTEVFGRGALRDDIQLGVDYFGTREVDPNRQLRLSHVLRNDVVDDESRRRHEEHCADFTEFLQLDVPAHERLDIGVHRELNRLFPMTLDPEVPHFYARWVYPTTAHLLSYEVGHWRCRCGLLTGQGNRHRAPCDGCGTRVTLDLFWELRRGKAHWSRYRVPLTLRIAVGDTTGTTEELDLVLMHLPLLLGIDETGGSIRFAPPDVLWLEDPSGPLGEPADTGRLVVIGENPRYDRQTRTRKVLEAALRRALASPGGPTLKRVLSTSVSADDHGSSANFGTVFTRRFESRIGHGLRVREARATDLARHADTSVECVVGVSHDLRGAAVVLNRDLARPGALAVRMLEHRAVVLGESYAGREIATRDVPDVERDRVAALDSDGIAAIGRLVQPGHLLVGVASPVPELEWYPEQRLLHAIFGDKAIPMRSRSLVLDGARPAEVVERKLTRTEVGELSEVVVTLASYEPVEVGDVLYGGDGGQAVVCDIADGLALMRISNTNSAADVVVAPEHPWAKRAGGRVRIGLDSTRLLRREVASCAVGRYSILTSRPLAYPAAGDPAQELDTDDFRWLLDTGAGRLAFELRTLRSDCVEWREGTRSLSARPRLANVIPPGPVDWSALTDSPAWGVQRWDRLLLGAGIRTTLSANGDLAFAALGDDDILAASSGLVRSPEKVHLPTGRTTEGGLFCERIFGPVVAWRCVCGERRGRHLEGVTCKRCGVEVLDNAVRRTRFGHIDLAIPAVHPWYLHGSLAASLGLPADELRDLAHGMRHLVVDSDDRAVERGSLLHDDDLRGRPYSGSYPYIRTVTGGEAVETLLRDSGLPADAVKGIVLRRLPVPPPDLRPLVRLADGRWAGADLNDLYARLIGYNDVLRRRIEEGPGLHPFSIKEMQEHVEAVVDNSRSRRPVKVIGGRVCKSLADMLRGDHGGTLRDQFLNTTAEFSARSRLVVGETGDIDRALVPDELLWNLFRAHLSQVLAAEPGDPSEAARMVDARTDQAVAAFESTCRRAVVVASLPTSSWRLFALRVQPTDGLAVRVHPDLLDELGWDQLGRRIKLFAVLSEEAEQDTAKLFPSRLRQDRPLPTARDLTLLDRDVDDLSTTVTGSILAGRSFPLAALDRLAFAHPAAAGELHR